MRVKFDDSELKRLYEDSTFHAQRYGPELVKAYRKKVGLIVAAANEQDLRSLRSLHFEKLAGSRTGQHSIRLNDQWRLIFRLENDDNGRLIVIVEVVDYQ